MPAGRPRKPTNLKLITGNPGKRALPENEPKPEASIPRCPKHLNKLARTAYYRIARYLNALGLMADLYGPFLAAAAQGYADWVTASEKLEVEPHYYKSATGYPVPNPLLRIKARALEQMKTFGVEFGMSPVAMTRIAGNAKPDEKSRDYDPAAKYFG
jgi:P27 family predicted phage terminase small subunit